MSRNYTSKTTSKCDIEDLWWVLENVKNKKLIFYQVAINTQCRIQLSIESIWPETLFKQKRVCKNYYVPAIGFSLASICL